MRRLSIIAHFPPRGVAVLGALVTFALTTPSGTAAAAPKKADAAKDAPASAASSAGPDAATKKAAREAYAAGEKAYAAADYKGALESFKKAHDLIPTIHAQFWMAMAESYGTDIAAAIASLDSVVLSPDADKLGDEKLNQANARLSELKKTPGSVVVSSTPPGADVALDGAAQPGMTPITLNAPPGTHHISVALKGYETYEADVSVKPGQKVDQKAELKEKAAVPAPAAAPPLKEEPVPAAPPPPPPPAEKHSNVPAYITLGVGVVGAGVGTVFGIKALSAKKEFDDHPTNSNADAADRNALIADMAFGVALTLGITGVVLLTSGNDSEAAAHEHTAPRPLRARLNLAPVVSPTVQGATARLTF